jgi:hypothetical protein
MPNLKVAVDFEGEESAWPQRLGPGFELEVEDDGHSATHWPGQSTTSHRSHSHRRLLLVVVAEYGSQLEVGTVSTRTLGSAAAWLVPKYVLQADCNRHKRLTIRGQSDCAM